MALLRRFTSTELSGVTTFGSLVDFLLNVVLSYGRECDEIHIVFDDYHDTSLKSSERSRRAKVKNAKVCQVILREQVMPEWSEFFSNSKNKKSLENFFVEQCKIRYKSDTPILYLAGGLESNPQLCTVVNSGTSRSEPLLSSSLEEADDRLMVNIRYIYEQRQYSSVVVYSPDTDILVMLIYHLKNTWNGMNIYLLRVAASRTVANKRGMQLFPLNKVLENFEGHVIDQLPAAHCLSGCDTVAKVGTKNAVLNVLKGEDNLLTYFGKDRLDEDMIADAEEFLVKIVASKKMKSLMTFDELRVKTYLQSRNKRIVDLPCTSKSLRQNIKRAYLQTKLRLNSPYLNEMDFSDPADYGFKLNLITMSLEPIMFEGGQIPTNVPEPCYNCTTCVRKTCPCRTAGTGGLPMAR